MAYIYKITNQLNNKIYIGKTLLTPEKRFKEHCRDALKETEKHRPLYSAMNKYGIENFILSIVEECSSEMIDEREKYWIEYYGSFKNGYNATIGGDGKSYVDYELIYNLYNQGLSEKQIIKLTHHDHHTISKILANYGISGEDAWEKYQKECNNNNKPVARLDLKTGEILEIFDSIGKAEKIFDGHNHISAVCKGKRKSCKGYGWKFL